jgi:hypothetical protein
MDLIRPLPSRTRYPLAHRASRSVPASTVGEIFWALATTPPGSRSPIWLTERTGLITRPGAARSHGLREGMGTPEPATFVSGVVERSGLR